MKLLLTTLNSKYIHSNLAVRYLYQGAKPFHGQLELKEYTINNDEDSIFVDLVRQQYDLAAFSCYIWNIRQTLYLAANLKKACPGITILLGGPEVSFQVRQLMEENPAVDFVLAGEGDTTFSEFLQSFCMGEQKKEYRDIKGLTWRQSGEIHVGSPAEPVDFTSVPFVYEGRRCAPDKVIYYESSRGCPYGCTYCLSCLEKGMRPLPLLRVKNDLDYFLSQQVSQVKLIDRTFNYHGERTMELIRFLMDRDNGVTNFHFELCGDLITEEFIELVSAARKGLFQFEIGVQSTNQQTLAACGRTSSSIEMGDKIRRIRSVENIHLHLDLIAGLPFEGYASFAQSFDDVYQMRPHELQLGFLKLLKGTPMRERAQEYGMTWREQAPYEVISTRWVSALEMVQLKQVETVLDLYSNRGGFDRTVEEVLDRFYTSPFHFFEELAKFYYSRGYQDRPHKKEDLYRIFYAFAAEKESSQGSFPEAEDGGRDCWNAEEIRMLLGADIKAAMNFDAVKKFEKKGWEMA